ncbi:MAG: alpha/beta hydrolase, partial [Burkholderiales bacterium]
MNPPRRLAARVGALLAATPLAGCSWGGALAAVTPSDARVEEGVAYGEDPRHRLDVVAPAAVP